MTQNEQIREIIRAIPAGDVFNRHDIKTALGDSLDRSQLNAISNILAEFVKLGMVKKGPHGVYIRNGKQPAEYNAPEKPEQAQVKPTGFYSVVRRFLESIPSGAKYNRQYIYNSLGVKKGEYNKMSTACKAIKELIDAGKAVKVDGYFKQSGDGAIDLRVLDDQPMIVYRGKIYQKDEFLKQSGLSISQLKYRIDYGFYNDLAIFETKSMKNAKYYAREFCNVGNVDGEIEMDKG